MYFCTNPCVFTSWTNMWKLLSGLTFCKPMNCTVHGILQARILEWVAFSFSKESSQPRDQTQVSHTAGGFFTNWMIRETQAEHTWCLTGSRRNGSFMNWCPCPLHLPVPTEALSLPQIAGVFQLHVLGKGGLSRSQRKGTWFFGRDPRRWQET